MKLAGAILLLTAVTASAAPPITGLWAARKDFAKVHGPLEIERDGNDWRASIAGHDAAVTVDHQNVSFALPGDDGSFRGTIRGERIFGFWMQPSGAETMRFATPVRLAKTSPSHWSGMVTPIDDHFTLFMPVTANADGSFATFLRNPERNFGRFMDVQHLTLDGTHVKLLGKNNAVVAEGTYDPEGDTISIPARGGTYDFHRATAADEAVFYPRGKTPPRYVYRKTIERDDGWPVGTLDEAGISRDAIAAFIDKVTAVPIDSVHASDIHAILIARHGKLVLEEYFHGTNPDQPHDTRSAAKSVTSVLIGAAKLPESTPVYQTMGIATDDPRKQAMTLMHLLTMSSGLDCDDNDDKSPGREDTIQEQMAQPDWIRYTLDLKNIRQPGEKSVYCSCQPNLAGGVLARKTGRWLPDLFRELIAEPMQIRRYGMFLTPTDDAYMGGGVRFLPRDFMKFGQMMIDGGKWNGRQIVSAEWVKASTSVHTKIGQGQYGYLWWINDYPYKGRIVRAFFADGNGGQVVMGIPELDLVIAFFGGNYADAAAIIPRNVYVPQDILPAVQERSR